MRQSNVRIHFVSMLLLLSVFLGLANSDEVNLSWNANTESDLAGYRLYHGTASGAYGSPTQIGLQTTHTVTGLSPATTYFFALSAFDTSGNESGKSNEVAFLVPPVQPPQSNEPPIAAYSFNETSGTVAVDSSSNGLNGTISGATFVAGKHGNALQFNGSAFVTVPAAAAFNLTNNFTASMWVKPTASNTTKGLLAHNDGGDNGFTIGFDGTGAVRFPQYNVGASTNSSNSMPLNEWAHVAAIQDSGISKLYVNGVLQTSTSPQVVESLPSANLVIGRIYSSIAGFGFTGVLDDVRIYNRVQTAAEITADMAADVGGQPPPPAPTITFSANPANILSSQPSVLTWSSTNATSVSIAPGVGVVAVSGTQSLSPVATTTYTATATGLSGTASASATVTVTPAAPVITITIPAGPCVKVNGVIVQGGLNCP